MYLSRGTMAIKLGPKTLRTVTVFGVCVLQGTHLKKGVKFRDSSVTV